jgi:hypothetical protein
VNETQVRILGRIAEAIDRQRRDGTASHELFNATWGLISAAEVHGTPDGDAVEALYEAASRADDARQPWMPAGHRGTDAAVDAALDGLRAWAVDLRPDD